MTTPAPQPGSGAAIVATTSDTSALVADVNHTIANGRRAARASTSNSQRNAVNRFDRYLQRHGLSLDRIADLANRNSSGLPILPPAVLLAYRIDRLAIKPSSAKTELSTVRSGLAAAGWDMSQTETHKWRNGLAPRIQHSHERQWLADGGILAERRCRPWLVDDLPKLLTTLETYGHHRFIRDLWLEQMRAIVRVLWFAAPRINEIVKMRYDWIQTGANGTAITFPAGLKHQMFPVTVDLTPTKDPFLCPVRALAAWIEAARQAGLPQRPGDRVFVEVAQFQSGPVGPAHSQYQRIWGDRLWVDRVDDLDGSPEFHPNLTATERREKAESVSAAMHRWAIQALLRRAELGTRDATETIGPHGARSGVALALDAAGASDVEIRLFLRHADVTTLDAYVRPSDRRNRAPVAAVFPDLGIADEAKVRDRLQGIEARLRAARTTHLLKEVVPEE